MASKWMLTKKISINYTLKYEESLIAVFLFKILKSHKHFLYRMEYIPVVSESCCIHLKTIIFHVFKSDNAFRKHCLLHLHLMFSKTLNNWHNNLRPCMYWILARHEKKSRHKSKTQASCVTYLLVKELKVSSERNYSYGKAMQRQVCKNNFQPVIYGMIHPTN